MMRKNRAAYLIVLLALLGLLLAFSKTFLLCALLLWLACGGWMGVLLWQDAKKLRVTMQIRPGEQVGRTLPLTFTVHATGRLWVVRSVLVELEVQNVMFRTAQTHPVFLQMAEGAEQFELPFHSDLCGETLFRCTQVRVQDFMGLFSRPCAPCPGARTTIYPQRAAVQIALSHTPSGTPRTDGRMQNRKGNDQSEMFDVREYQPGDDLRAMHWKLSSKMDRLMLRQASAPSNHSVALMPDLGLTRAGQPISQSEQNGAVALGIAIGEQLIQQGTAFCVALPTENGMPLWEVRNLEEFQRVLSQWLSCPVRQESGAGPKYFQAEHQEFTQLILLSAGRYSGDLNCLDRQIGVTVVSAVDSQTPVYARLGRTRQVVEIPTKTSGEEVFRILC